jgi:hypothetical protein
MLYFFSGRNFMSSCSRTNVAEESAFNIFGSSVEPSSADSDTDCQDAISEVDHNRAVEGVNKSAEVEQPQLYSAEQVLSGEKCCPLCNKFVTHLPRHMKSKAHR